MKIDILTGNDAIALSDVSDDVDDDPSRGILAIDLNLLDEAVTSWKENLPSVTPYYAVKCLPNIDVVSLLASKKGK